MGRGIALAFAYAGTTIALIDLKQRRGRRLRAAGAARLARKWTASLRMLAELGAMPAEAVASACSARITLVPEAQAAQALPQAEVVFEGVPETLEAKRERLRPHLRAAPRRRRSSPRPPRRFWSPTWRRSPPTRSG